MPRAGEKNFEGEASVSSRGADAKTRRASRDDAKNARFAPTRMAPSVRMDRVASSGRSQRRVERERAPRFGASTGISPIPTVRWVNLWFCRNGCRELAHLLVACEAQPGGVRPAEDDSLRCRAVVAHASHSYSLLGDATRCDVSFPRFVTTLG